MFLRNANQLGREEKVKGLRNQSNIMQRVIWNPSCLHNLVVLYKKIISNYVYNLKSVYFPPIQLPFEGGEAYQKINYKERDLVFVIYFLFSKLIFHLLLKLSILTANLVDVRWRRNEQIVKQKVLIRLDNSHIVLTYYYYYYSLLNAMYLIGFPK